MHGLQSRWWRAVDVSQGHSRTFTVNTKRLIFSKIRAVTFYSTYKNRKTGDRYKNSKQDNPGSERTIGLFILCDNITTLLKLDRKYIRWTRTAKRFEEFDLLFPDN